MKDLDQLIESAVSSRKKGETFNADSFLDLIYEVISEQKLNEKGPLPAGAAPSVKTKTAKEFLLTLPKFSPNEAWGDPASQDRQTIGKIFSTVGGGASIEGKLKFLQRIADPGNKITSPRRIISTLIILESLAAVVNSFSSSAAGFVFEGFLSALLLGKQEAEISAKGNLPIQDLIAFSEIGGGTPVSLKLLNEKTNIEGSYTNLVDALDEFGEMIYIVARKKGDELVLEQFTLTRDNFMDAISMAASGKSRTKDKNLMKLPKRTPESSIRYIQKLPTWEEKYEALSQTAGYRGSAKKAPQPEEEPQREPSEEEIIQSFSNLQPEEEVIQESKGPQWGISPQQLSKLQGVDYKQLGTLPSSSGQIEKIAEMHMDKLSTSLMDLFESTKMLSDNVNNYFVSKERDEAITAGQNAIKDTQKIENSLKQEIDKES